MAAKLDTNPELLQKPILAVSKLAAGRPKDRNFVATLLAIGAVDRARLSQLIETMPQAEQLKARLPA